MFPAIRNERTNVATTRVRAKHAMGSHRHLRGRESGRPGTGGYVVAEIERGDEEDVAV